MSLRRLYADKLNYADSFSNGLNGIADGSRINAAGAGTFRRHARSEKLRRRKRLRALGESLSASDSSGEFLRGLGELPGLIRSFPWANTPLGPISTWPQCLKTATGLLLASPVPMVMLWGPEGVMIYNDAYSVFAGARHPGLLGMNVREAWPEVADFNDNVMRVGLAGGTLSYTDQELVLNRRGTPEKAWMNLDYSPVPDERGEPAGVIAVVIETTERVKADAALQSLNADLEKQVLERTQARGMTWRVSPDLLGALNARGYFETSNPAWQSVLGWSDAEVASMTIFDLLHPDDVERTRAGFALTQIGQPAIRFPNRYRCKNGSYRWISWVGIPEEGLVYCSGRDITDDVAAEAERERLWTLSEDMLARADYSGAMSAVAGRSTNCLPTPMPTSSAPRTCPQRRPRWKKWAAPASRRGFRIASCPRTASGRRSTGPFRPSPMG